MRASDWSAGKLLSLTAAVGIVSGLGEATAGVYRHRVDHLPTGAYVAGEIFWMTPLAAVFSCVTIWLVWMGLSAVLPKRWELRGWGPCVAAGIAAYGLLTAMSLGLAVYARCILSAGIAFTLWRAMGAQRSLVQRSARLLLLVVPVALAVVAVAVPIRRRAEEARALAVLPPAPANAPNVVVLIWDTARALDMSLYGYVRATTPVLDSLARHGLTFDHAFATAPWSLPSHASIFTGQYPSKLTVGPRIPLDGTHPTMAEWFTAHGYASAGITANLFYGSSDYGIGRGFSMYDERPPISISVIAYGWQMLRRTLLPLLAVVGSHDNLNRRRASDVNAAFDSWLDRRGGRPFLAVLNYFDAHEPYRPPAPFDTAFAPAGTRYWADETLFTAPPEVTQQLRDVYDGAIRYIDWSLGEMIEVLRRRGLMDNTILVVTADHGEEFGERGPVIIGHNRSLYRAVLHVPLVIVYPPRVAAGQRYSGVVSIRDIPATVANLALPAEGHPFPGTALARLVRDPSVADTSEKSRLAVSEKHRWATRREGWPTSWGSMYSVFDSSAQYISDAVGGELLFSLETDPWDAHNIASAAERSAQLIGLRSRLEAYVGPPATRVARTGAKPAPPGRGTGAPGPR